MSVEIETRPSSFEVSPHGAMTGEIGVHLGGHWFPEHYWSDFLVVILDWWLYELRPWNNAKELEFLFMDGPCMLVLVQDAAGWKMTCLRNGKTSVPPTNIE